MGISISRPTPAWVTAVAPILFLAACSSTPTASDGAASGTVARALNSPGAVPAAPAPSSRPVARVELPQGTRQSARVPANRSIYFDFDEYAIGPDGQTVVLANADYLTRNTSARAVIEGSADERGSREYNLALGQRRAEAVRKALASQGVAASRLEAVSIGEERPRNPGHDDAAWAENRRADIQFR